MTKAINRKSITTDRLTISFIEDGEPGSPPLVLIHGNVSSNVFWEDTVKAFLPNYHVIAPDLRGFGETQAFPIDAERGMKDWSEDLVALLSALNITQPIHIVGWSLGGGVAMQFAIDHTRKIRSLILLNSISCYGFGGTKDLDGTPCFSSFSGSGGGTVNPDFLERVKKKDYGDESPNSPKNVLNQFYFKPPFRLPVEKEQSLIASMLSTCTTEENYPGPFEPCADWPGIAPGRKGVNNAISPKYFNLSAITQIEPKVPILWIRGDNDLIVSDTSMFDLGYLGQNSFIEGWPGPAVYPPQPMVSQTRSVLNKYRQQGGFYQETVIRDTGHSPQIEKPEEFQNTVHDFITAHR